MQKQRAESRGTVSRSQHLTHTLAGAKLAQCPYLNNPT